MNGLMRIAAVLASCAVALVAVAADCPLGFTSPRSYDRGLALRIAVETADFDLDGRPDIASLHRYGNDGTADRNGTLLLNKGHDVFDSRPIIAPGDFATLAAGFVNSDANPDLVLGGSTPLTTLLGNGDGTFRTGAAVDVRNVTSIALGQFDGKNGNDIAVTQAFPSAVTILLATTTGSYTVGASYALNDQGVTVASADLDNDGRADLVVGDRAVVTPYFGAGDGTFTKGLSLTSVPPVSVAIGDIDRDGRRDIILGGSSGVTIYLNAGGRAFRLNGINTLIGDAQSIALTDVDHDANPDVVAVGSSDISVFRGSPGGTLFPPTVYAGGANAVSGAVADFSGDGLVDVAVSNLASGDISVLKNLGLGQLEAMRRIDGGSGAVAFVRADVNEDGFDDVVLASETGGTIVILPGRAAGMFDSPVGYVVGFTPRAFALGDFNGDLNVDIVAISTDGKNAAVLVSNVDGTLSSAVPIAVPNPLTAIDAGDLNGDGRDDLVMTEQDGALVVRLSTGGATFGPPTSYSIPGTPTAVVVEDLDFDRSPEVAVATPANVFIFRGSPSGALTFATSIDIGGTTVLQTGLIDADPRPDLVVGGNGVDIFFNDAGLSFTRHQHLSAATSKVTALVIDDLNGDTRADIAATNFNTGTSEHFITPFFSRGDGFETQPAIQTDVEPSAIVSGDFDRDGTRDLIVAAGDETLFSRGRCAVPAVTIAAARNPVQSNSPVTLIANVVSGSARGGVVTFLVDGKVVGAANTDPFEPGLARMTLQLAPGTHQLSAIVRFPEDTSSVSETVPVVVIANNARRRAARH